MGITVSGDALNQAFQRFKELADRKIQLSEADLEAIVAEELGTRIDGRWEVESIAAVGGARGAARGDRRAHPRR